jgi:hypothetical protein
MTTVWNEAARWAAWAILVDAAGIRSLAGYDAWPVNSHRADWSRTVARVVGQGLNGGLYECTKKAPFAL